MNYYLNGEMERHYNCNNFDIDKVPFEKRQHPILGVSYILLFCFYESIYIPCLWALTKRFRFPCYRLMFGIGIADVVVLSVCGLFTGYLSITGKVFCSHPHLIFVAGVIGVGLWAVESSAAMILAFNRFVELSAPDLCAFLFNGWRSFVWIVAPWLYGFYWIFTTRPVLFSGIYASWFMNPYVGYVDDFGVIYHDFLNATHNITILCGISGLYIIFMTMLFFKTPSGQANQHTSYSRMQKTTFLQVLVISACNATAAGIYTYMQFFPTNEYLIYLGQYMWICAHGAPGMIYLAMNKTIRKDVRNLLRKKTTITPNQANFTNSRPVTTRPGTNTNTSTL